MHHHAQPGQLALAESFPTDPSGLPEATSPALLELAHGLWDGLHGHRGIHTRIPWWYVPLCIGFDVVVGIYLLVAF